MNEKLCDRGGFSRSFDPAKKGEAAIKHEARATRSKLHRFPVRNREGQLRY
jgi:hypothetical protein